MDHSDDYTYIYLYILSIHTSYTFEVSPNTGTDRNPTSFLSFDLRPIVFTFTPSSLYFLGDTIRHCFYIKFFLPHLSILLAIFFQECFHRFRNLGLGTTTKQSLFHLPFFFFFEIFASYLCINGMQFFVWSFLGVSWILDLNFLFMFLVFLSFFLEPNGVCWILGIFTE